MLCWYFHMFISGIPCVRRLGAETSRHFIYAMYYMILIVLCAFVGYCNYVLLQEVYKFLLDYTVPYPRRQHPS